MLGHECVLNGVQGTESSLEDTFPEQIVHLLLVFRVLFGRFEGSGLFRESAVKWGLTCASFLVERELCLCAFEET